MARLEASLLLANPAEVINGLVYAHGIGWDRTTTPAPPMSLIAIAHVPWDMANQAIELRVTLVDEDGREPHLAEDENGNPAPLQITSHLEVGRPPGAKHGSSTPCHLALNLNAGLPLERGRYEWRLGLDGKTVSARAFTVE